MVNVGDITITSLETITVFDIVTGNYRFTLDELQDCSIAQAQDTTEITGKGGRKLNTLKRNKTITITGTNGLISGGLLEMQTGGKFENAPTEVMWTDHIVIKGSASATMFKAVGTEGKEIISIRLKNADNTLGEELVQDATAAEGKFTYDPDTKVLGFSGLEDGVEAVVYYKRKIAADVLRNDSDVYSEKGIIYIDAIGEDKCSKLYRVQIQIPKGDFSGEFSIDMGGDQSVHGFEIESLAGACGTSGQLFSYVVFGVDSEDANA